MLSFVSGEFALLLRAPCPRRTFLSTLRKFRIILSFLNKEGGPCKAWWMVLIEDAFENVLADNKFFRTYPSASLPPSLVKGRQRQLRLITLRC